MSEMLRCGLLGEKLGHSYSPAIHAELADYQYKLYEVDPENLEEFILHGEWDCLNVTIPYKKAVIPFCSGLSEIAEKIGSVNVLVRHKDGTITGDNTDAFGFEKLVERTGVNPKGKKAIILGNGGACRPVNEILKKLGAETVVISRSGEDNYENLSRHYNAEIIANTTPVGMYPNNGKAAVELKNFKNCKAVMELIYNPARTELMVQAEELGIVAEGGLYMLVAQAKRACELFTGRTIDDREIDRIEKKLSLEMQNIVLVGMPGCGKTTVAGILGTLLGKNVIETDKMIVEKAGMTIPEIFEKFGEKEFRRIETEVMAEAGKMSGAIISTGGGCVTIPVNYNLLHQNGRIVWIKRDINQLSKEGRPISQKSNLAQLYEARRASYERFADFVVENNSNPENTAREIIGIIGE